MHTAILWACAIVAVIVFGVMVYSIATFRGGPGPAPASFRLGMPLSILREVIWALIPIAIVIGAALPAVRIIGAADVSVAEAVE